MQRPVSLIVFGVLNLVFALLGVMGFAFSALLLFGGMQAALDPVTRDLFANPAYLAFLKISMLIGLVALLALGAAGIGLLLTKPWGRTLSIGYGVYAILMSLVGMVVNYLFVWQPQLERIQRMAAGPEQAAMYGGMIGGACGGCVGLIYPVLLLVFMFRPNVIAAMRGAQDFGPFAGSGPRGQSNPFGPG